MIENLFPNRYFLFGNSILQCININKNIKKTENRAKMIAK